MSLQAKLDAFKADFKSGKPPYNAPPQVHAVMERATAELDRLRPGRPCRRKQATRRPGLRWQIQTAISSSVKLLAAGPLVVSFYRGVWCPYCNMELQALQEALPQFRALGASLVAVSPQNPVNSRKSVRQNHLDFPILSDTHNDVANAFGLRFALPDYLVDLYKGFKNDLPAFNGDDSWTLPMPARYVIAQDGAILYAEVNPDYTQRPEPADMLPVLQGARGRATA